MFRNLLKAVSGSETGLFNLPMVHAPCVDDGPSSRQNMGLLASRQVPCADGDGEISLGIRRIYLMPTRSGLMYFVMLILMSIASVHYGLQAGLIMAALIAGTLWSALIQALRHLHGLHWQVGESAAVFDGQDLMIPFAVRNPSQRPRLGIRLQIGKHPPHDMAALPGGSHAAGTVCWRAGQAGVWDIPAIRISTETPLGLWCTFAYWRPAGKLWVYPAPEQGLVPQPTPSRASQGAPAQSSASSLNSHEGEDLAGLRQAHEGELLTRIAWKAMARHDGPPIARLFEAPAPSSHRCLSWEDAGALPHPQRLMRLTRWLLDAYADKATVSMELPGRSFGPGRSQAHLHNMLRELARRSMRSSP